MPTTTSPLHSFTIIEQVGDSYSTGRTLFLAKAAHDQSHFIEVPRGLSSRLSPGVEIHSGAFRRVTADGPPRWVLTEIPADVAKALLQADINIRDHHATGSNEEEIANMLSAAARAANTTVVVKHDGPIHDRALAKAIRLARAAMKADHATPEVIHLVGNEAGGYSVPAAFSPADHNIIRTHLRRTDLPASVWFKDGLRMVVGHQSYYPALATLNKPAAQSRML